MLRKYNQTHRIAWSFTSTVLLLCAGVLAFLVQGRMTPQPLTAERHTPAHISPLAEFPPYSGRSGPSDIAALFDGRREKFGTVLANWRADSMTTGAACKSALSANRGYYPPCADLFNQRIIAVHVDDLQPPLVVYVPVSRIATIANGQRVRIRMGQVTADGKVHALPRFDQALPAASGATHELRTPE